MQLNKSVLFKLSSFTLFGFSAIGMCIIYFFQEIDIATAIFRGSAWHLQIALGLGFGVASALIGWLIMQLPFMQNVNVKFIQMFSTIRLQFDDIVFYSFCAGVGEEMLFRAALQPIFGLWFTSVVFVAVHGYLDPRNGKMLLYGIFLVFVSAGMGFLFEVHGIFAAILAHIAYDILMFCNLIYFQKNNAVPSKADPMDRE